MANHTARATRRRNTQEAAPGGRASPRTRAAAATRPQLVSDVVPRYYQVYSLLRQRLLAGAWPPERAMPTEESFAAEFAVARVTIRNALRLLEQEKLVVRVRGRGTFAVAAQAPGRLNFGGLLEAVADVERKTHVRLLSFERLALPAEAAQLLECPVGSVGVAIERVRSDRQGPFSYTRCFLREPEAALVTRDRIGNRTVLATLVAAGVQAGAAEQRVSATLADVEVARLLHVDVGAPLVKLTRIVRNADERPIELIQGLYRPDRYEYRVKVSRSAGGETPQWVLK
ncbi:MAG: GntR family transcriptional regulator [Burkholderiales bacterium]|nr:GntR family transcriptional regulator [Burkholderiales bacterium]